MKIGIDISQVIYGTGVYTYTKNLLANLLLIDKDNQYLLLGGSLRRLNDLASFATFFGDKIEKRFFPIPPTLADIIWNRLHVLPIETLVGKLDVFHSSDWTQPPTSAFKVTTVHDLAPILLPRFTNPKIVSAHRARLGWVKKEVDRVIAPSNKTKEDLIKFGVEEGKIKVIPEAPDPIFKPVDSVSVEELKRKYQITGKYLLGVGINERKNTPRIIEAFEKVRTSGLKLVLIGEAKIGLGQSRGVIPTGFVPENEKPILYSGAEALVYPSLYEGFGLPILEAFACGCPVITSNISSMPEVAANAGVLVDPLKVNSIAEGISQALRQRKTLIKKGFIQVKKFSWEKAARQTLETYNERP